LGKISNILIIDDELNSRELLYNLVLKYFDKSASIVAVDSILKAGELINQHEYDVIFSDSRMPFDTIDNLINIKRNKKTQFVLCTALNNNEVKNSFHFPIYFLQKPIDIEDFKTICAMIKDQLKAIDNALII
jgi:two-component system LytT family response regulator